MQETEVSLVVSCSKTEWEGGKVEVQDYIRIPKVAILERKYLEEPK